MLNYFEFKFVLPAHNSHTVSQEKAEQLGNKKKNIF